MAYWAATQLQPRRERVAEYFLEQFGFEVYLPRVHRCQIRWRRRIDFLTQYFPGHCFTRIELRWHSVRQCPGVIRLVRVGGDEPVHVSDEVIDALRKREHNGAIDLPTERAPRIGDRVQIVFGPFVGHLGLCRVSRLQSCCSCSRLSVRCGCAATRSSWFNAESDLTNARA
jgi:transcription antitermination factor NusG